jgi:uncharacterized protein
MNKKLNKSLLVIIFCALLLGCVSKKLPNIIAEINNKNYSFEVAANSEARKTGLMFRKKLAVNSGMLFVYNRELILNFYMKNTLIPLDIGFIDANYKIIDIQEMQPLDETTITSKGEAQYALEVNRGFFKKAGLKTGDKINFISPIPYFDN